MALAAPAMAQAACDRATLQDIADRYVAAQAQGSLFALPVGEWVDYRENLEMTSSATGVLGTPMPFAWTLKLLDPQQCKVFVEGVILEPKEVVLATVVNNGFFGVNQIGTVIGGGNAAEALVQARGEDWGEIPADGRADRTQLLAVANAHLDGLDDEIVERSFVVDESRGAVGVFARADDVSGPAASYALRIEDGAVRYVHAGVSVD
jgi:hypothetical protein